MNITEFRDNFTPSALTPGTMNRLIYGTNKAFTPFWDDEKGCFRDPDMDAEYREWLASGGAEQFLAYLPEYEKKPRNAKIPQ